MIGQIVTPNITTSAGGGINYSTSEQNTGLKWIDGKDIYQKTIDCGSLPGSSHPWKQVSCNITGLNTCISCQGIAYNGQYYLNLPFAGGSNNSIEICYDKLNDNINFTVMQDASQYVAYVTILYTKS